MTTPIHHAGETTGNDLREALAQIEPRSLRTFTPTQAVIAASAGVYHWTPEGRRLYDFTSGVLVSNLGHNPANWMRRFGSLMGWREWTERSEYFKALPMTAYNAVTPIEIQASARLLQALQACPGARRMDQVMWAASGSEAIQKALWVGQARDRTRPMILATRFGFHGRKASPTR